MSYINKEIAQATKWSVATEIVVKLISPVTNMILARILTPEMFGVVATLTMIVSFAEIFTDAGFQKYLVQHDFENEDDLNQSTNVAFWTNLAFSLLLWGMISVFAVPLARLVGSSGKESAIIAMSAQIPVLAFSSIQMARYRRDLDFKSLFMVRMVTAFVPLVITVPLALIVRNYWALVWGTLAKDILNALILTVRSRWRPRLTFSFSRLYEMLSFTFWTIIENISLWLTNYVDILVVGIALNEYYLGLYKTTMSTVNSFMGIITAATLPVLFSSLSRYQSDRRLFCETFLRFQRGAAVLLLPIGFGLFVYRELAVVICLGSQWTEVMDFFGLWSLVSAVVIVLSHYDSEVFRSIGKPKLSVLAQFAHLVFMIPMLIWSLQKDYQTIYIVRSLMRLPGIAVSACIMHFAVKIRVGSIIKNICPSLVSSVIMAFAGALLRDFVEGVIWQLFTIVICVFIYVAAMLILPSGRRQVAEIPFLQRLLRIKTQ